VGQGDPPGASPRRRTLPCSSPTLTAAIGVAAPSAHDPSGLPLGFRPGSPPPPLARAMVAEIIKRRAAPPWGYRGPLPLPPMVTDIRPPAPPRGAARPPSPVPLFRPLEANPGMGLLPPLWLRTRTEIFSKFRSWQK
jgi:hypothetical protein